VELNHKSISGGKTMAEIRPFAGLRYNQSIVKDIAKVICPPYDVISSALHDDLHARSPYNFIRLEDAKTSPGDSPANNKYTRTAATLADWLDRKILTPEQAPAVYLDEHYFSLNGKAGMRRGIIARIRLEEWEKGIIRPHEKIFAAAKEDRQNLLKTLKVNTSPVLMMYQDPDRVIADTLATETQKEPVIDATIPEGDRHKVWAITNKAVVNRIAYALSKQPFYVADGHHRYTSALMYSREQMAADSRITPDAAVNFVMTTLVDFADPGLIILAPHRVIRGLTKEVLADLHDKLASYFAVTEMPANDWQKLDAAMQKPGGIRLGFFGPGKEMFYALKLRDEKVLAQIMPNSSDIYRNLDVAVLDHLILNKILGLAIDGSNEPRVSFSHDRGESVQEVLKGDQQAVFFLKPIKPELIKTVSDAKEIMPRKSTYFYPKAPAGLVVNTLF
jgi:uncharacterized protein (DUF1015 family)